MGALEPDKMLSSILAVDEHTRENGCLQLLEGSHRLGRLPHGVEGEQVISLDVASMIALDGIDYST